MPFVNIKITRDGATKDQKEALIAGVTDLLRDVLGKNPKTTLVLIEEVETDNWGLGGESVTAIRARQIDPEKVRELAGLTADWFADKAVRPVLVKYLALWARGHDAFLRGAPALVVAYTASNAPFGAVDTGIALTFLELAAVARGLSKNASFRLDTGNGNDSLTTSISAADNSQVGIDTGNGNDNLTASLIGRRRSVR